ncbi:DNA replication licensing factor mcm4-A-like isoform X2 [Corticium candelabrum]|uniref:DNA replication licensing factor mcm4-A-like isoform X2 n=1 Tax=Corticium candelabrum TaxID=121492 RepID=UPI002E26D828|nr:DNA replication licensing factor mcm4-A-like isoform X2 [Corticium candelabrum]
MSSTGSTPRSSQKRSRTGTPKSARSRSQKTGPLSSSPLPLAASSPSGAHDPDQSLFSSPPPQRRGTNEAEMSSPLTYGTPSTKGTPQPGHGTPVHSRPDVRASRHHRTVNLGSSSGPGGGGSDPLGPSSSVPQSVGDTQPGDYLVVWGTDVNVKEAKEKFKKFLCEFREEVDDMINDDETPYYLQRLDEINTLEEPFLSVDCSHIKRFNHYLYTQLIRYPQEVIPTFDMAANEVFYNIYPEAQLEHQIQLITISGMVIRTSNLIPEMREAFFCCSVCHNTESVEIDRGRIAEPNLCRSCNTYHSFQLIHNRSHFTDKQTVKLQESPDDMPAGQTPYTVILYAHNDLVDTVHPGDRVTVTGIYRAVPLKVQPTTRHVKSVYKTYVDVIHFRKSDTKRLYRDEEGKDAHFTEERIEQLKALSRMPDIYERLARALAPSIYENEDIKKGILSQLFGGTVKDFGNAGRGKFRSEINVLLCGDPGTSKSQLLRYVHSLVPRGQYTSGKGSSAVGLTAYITKDPETRQHVLQTGALVLSDGGICCIDEFDKMNDSTRAVLHEVMEQQTLSIAKAGIICSLNARTSILAAANPRESRWNAKLTTIENLQLPHTLLSRFDLIFLMLDPQDEQFDRRLATHLVSLYHQTREEDEEQSLDMSSLRDYIAYARTYINPKLGEEAGQSLTEAYVEMRKVGSHRGAVTAYPRQLESLIRLAESHARMRFSEVVEKIDVEEAKRLHREALKQAATDPKTGIVDISILTTGLSSWERSRRVEIMKAVKQMLESRGKAPTVKYLQLFAELKDQSDKPINQAQFDDALRGLEDDNFLIRTGNIIRLLQD